MAAESAKYKKRLVTVKFYQDSEVEFNKQLLARINSAHGAYLKKVAAWTNTFYEVMIMWIFLESGGVNAKPNKFGATGLMQITPATANETIRIEKRTGRMNENEEGELKRLIGKARFDCIVGQSWDAQKKSCNANRGLSITNADLMNVEFNMLVGALYLKQMIDKHIENGVYRLDRTIVNYNQGRYAKIPEGTPMQLYANVGAIETKNYIAKAVGINGIFETIS